MLGAPKRPRHPRGAAGRVNQLERHVISVATPRYQRKDSQNENRVLTQHKTSFMKEGGPSSQSLSCICSLLISA